jgi:hypothetical protein
MKVFISSVVRGFEQFRAAAKDAVETLNMKPIMSEHFGGRAYSFEHGCLAEVDQCDVYILTRPLRSWFQTWLLSMSTARRQRHRP